MRTHSQPRPAGHVLLITVCVIAVIGLVLVGYLRLSDNQKHLVMRSQLWNSSMPLAEAGIDEAMAHCNQNLGTNMASNGWGKIANEYWKTNFIGEGYYVARISETMPYVIHCTGYHPMPRSSEYVSRTVRVRTRFKSPFPGAIVVRNTLSLNGNNVMTDSFDSSDSTKSTFGKYDPAKAGDKGDVACMGGVIDSFDVGNANIWGHAYTGPNGKLAVGPSGAVGSVAWHKGGNSGIESGWWLTDFSAAFEDVQAPFSIAPPPTSGLLSGIAYDYILGNGNYMAKDLTKKVIVTGHAILYVTDQVNFSSGDVLEILPGASLSLYMAGQNATFTSIVNHNSTAASFRYYGLPSNTSVKIQATADVTAAIYAPGAEITLVGGAELFGSVVGKDAKLTGHSKVHYDEALRTTGGISAVVIASWDEL